MIRRAPGYAFFELNLDRNGSNRPRFALRISTLPAMTFGQFGEYFPCSAPSARSRRSSARCWPPTRTTWRRGRPRRSAPSRWSWRNRRPESPAAWECRRYWNKARRMIVRTRVANVVDDVLGVAQISEIGLRDDDHFVGADDARRVHAVHPCGCRARPRASRRG